MSFHPDDAFEDYINNGEHLFTYNDAMELNNYMDKCFSICNHNNEDIYELAMKYVMAT